MEEGAPSGGGAAEEAAVQAPIAAAAAADERLAAAAAAGAHLRRNATMLLREGGADAVLSGGGLVSEAQAREAVRKAAPTCETLLVVGHNPGIQDLVLDMLRESSGPLSVISRVESRFPTAAAAVFVIDAQGRPRYDGLFFPDKVR